MEDAFAVGDFLLGLEELAADAIHSRIRFLVDVAVFLASAPHLFCRADVGGARRADERVRRKVERAAQLLHFLRVVIDVSLHLLPRFLRRLEYLLAVLVRARIEKDVFARNAPGPRDRIGLDYFEREAD